MTSCQLLENFKMNYEALWPSVVRSQATGRMIGVNILSDLKIVGLCEKKVLKTRSNTFLETEQLMVLWLMTQRI